MIKWIVKNRVSEIIYWERDRIDYEDEEDYYLDCYYYYYVYDFDYEVFDDDYYKEVV